MSIRNEYTRDLREVIGKILGCWFVCVVAIVLMLWAITGSSQSIHKTYDNYSEITAIANESFDAEQREMLAGWMYSSEDLNDDGFFIEREEPVTFWDIIIGNLNISCAIIIGVFSFVATLVYVLRRNDDYYVADLPFKTFYGWFILIVCFVGWPFFLISRVRLQRFKKRRKAEDEEEKTRVNTVKLPELDPVFDEKAFMAFCYEMLPSKKRIKQAEKNLAEDESRIRSLGKTLTTTTEELKKAQIKVGQDRAKLNDLRSEKNAAMLDPKTKDQILHDFAEIKTMHGVKQIFADDDGNLVVTVRADYEFYGVLYDIGDFELTIYDDELIATPISDRSSNIHYYGEQFCFGDRAEDIDDYVRAGRIVEAVELAIACINHINIEHMDDIPQRYKKIIN